MISDTHSTCLMLSACHMHAVPSTAAPLACIYTIWRSTLASLTHPIKFQQLSFNMESGISRGFKVTAHGFFQRCSPRHCLVWVYQSGISISTVPFHDSKQTHIFFPFHSCLDEKGKPMILQQLAPNSTISVLTPACRHQLHGRRPNAARFVRETSPTA